MKKFWARIHSGLDAAGRRSGLDLHLELTRPRVRGLETALREAVQTGRLPPGRRLPSSRTLAADLGVARNTVADAYGQLVAEGWLTAAAGLGHPGRRARRAPPPGGRRGGCRCRPAAAAIRHDLRPGVPDLSAFPRAAWLAAARRALTAAPAAAFGYGDPRGRPSCAPRWPTTWPGPAACGPPRPDRGLRRLRRGAGAAGPGAGGPAAPPRLAVEAYGHRSTATSPPAPGCGCARCRSTPHGAVTGAARPDGAAVLLTPAHQFPLGVALAPPRRDQVVDWAAADRRR